MKSVTIWAIEKRIHFSDREIKRLKEIGVKVQNSPARMYILAKIRTNYPDAWKNLSTAQQIFPQAVKVT
jgi:hypothetical protein